MGRCLGATAARSQAAAWTGRRRRPGRRSSAGLVALGSHVPRAGLVQPRRLARMRGVSVPPYAGCVGVAITCGGPPRCIGVYSVVNEGWGAA